MSSDWAILTISQCLERVVDNRGKTPPVSSGPTQFGLIEINAIVGEKKYPDAKLIRKFVAVETYNTWFRSGHPVVGDILFSTVGSIAEVAIFDGYGCIAQNVVGLRPNKKIINPDYLYYVLTNPITQKRLRSLDISSVQPSIKLPHLLAVEIAVPDLFQQSKVASLLSVLDERISLLHSTNATLEAIAQALFKSWFVDFDPVRAKEEGRTPEGMDEATVALFPDGLEDSELGLVPKGWQPKRVGDFIDLAYGKALKANDRVFGVVPVYGSGGITGWHNAALVNSPSVIIGRKGTVGSLYWESRPFFPIDTVFYVKTKYPLTYCYCLLQTLGLTGMNTDAAVPGLNRENVYRLKVPVCPQTLLSAFDTIVSPLRASIDQNLQQAQTLTRLRDTLLPRLISGQLRIPEVVAQIDALAA